MELLEKPLAKIRARRILKYIPRGGSICDVGCGIEPKFLLDLGGLTSESCGVDKKTINRIWGKGVQTFKKNLDSEPRLPFNGDRFDCVTLIAALEHLRFPKEILQEARRILKVSGTVIITTPTPYAKPILEFLAFLGLVSREEVGDHKHYYNKQALISFLEDLGFNIIRHRYFELGLNQIIVAQKIL